MTEEQQNRKPQTEAANNAPQVDRAALSAKIQAQMALSVAERAAADAMRASRRDAQLEELQYIPGGRIRLWSDGTITVSIGGIR